MNTSHQFALVDGLTTNELYGFTVVAVNENGSSLPSSIIIINVTEQGRYLLSGSIITINVTEQGRYLLSGSIITINVTQQCE